MRVIFCGEVGIKQQSRVTLSNPSSRLLTSLNVRTSSEGGSIIIVVYCILGEMMMWASKVIRTFYQVMHFCLLIASNFLMARTRWTAIRVFFYQSSLFLVLSILLGTDHPCWQDYSPLIRCSQFTLKSQYLLNSSNQAKTVEFYSLSKHQTLTMQTDENWKYLASCFPSEIQ